MFCRGASRPAGPWCSAKYQSAYKSLTGRHQAVPGDRNSDKRKEGKEREIVSIKSMDREAHRCESVELSGQRQVTGRGCG